MHLISLLVFLLCSLMFTWAQAHSFDDGIQIDDQQRLSDSLVQNLSCADLSEEKILQHVRGDAFSAKHHIPIRNWKFGALGACWAMAHAQRLVFYLARFDSAVAVDREKFPAILNMFRGNITISSTTLKGQRSEHDEPAPLLVFQTGSENILDFNSPNIFADLSNGIEGGRRTFATELEYFEAHRFYDLGNLPMIFGSADRGADINGETIEKIRDNVFHHRLTLIDLRPNRISQHTVLVKAIRDLPNDEGYQLILYDSNYPQTDNSMIYQQHSRAFYAPNVISEFSSVDNPQSAIGVFIKDEDDMDDINSTLLQHYREVCQAHVN